MNTKSAQKVFRTIFIFVIVVGIIWVPSVNVVAQGVSPKLTPGMRDGNLDKNSVMLQDEPPQCQPGNTVTGTVFETDGITPIEFAIIQIEDFETGQIMFVSSTGQNGNYGCYLPEGDYRIMASGQNYSFEYYDNTDAANAARIQVTGNAQFSGLNFTLTKFFFFEHFTFNLDNPILQELTVRQAIALGTNRQQILNEAFLPNGIYGIVLNSVVPPEHWAAAPNTELTLYPFDPIQARAILETAGWIDRDNDGYRENQDGVELVFTFKTTTALPRMASGEIFRQNMEQIGIRIDTIFGPLDFLSQGDFDIVEFAWLGIDNSDNTMLDQYKTNVYTNFGGYSNPSFDSALASAELANSRDEKLPYLITAQKILTQELPVLPLFPRYGVNPLPTLTGEDVTTSLTSYLTINFDNVTESGVSTVISFNASPISPPQGFQFLGKIYDVGTNATFTTAQACFTYDDSGLTLSQENEVRLFHLENNLWVDVTDNGYPDIDNNITCGTVNSFSPFAVLYRPIVAPVTPLLDNFDRPDGAIGSNWKGSVSYYKIVGKQVDVRGNGPIYWKYAFGVNQEAYVTITNVDPAGKEQDLLLKVQGGASPNWGSGVIEVLYSPSTSSVTVWTFRPDTLKWYKYPALPVTFTSGDQFGAQALATGEVVIYKNGMEVGRVTLNAADQAFFNPKGGYIGIWFIDARNAYFDDFGGGDVKIVPPSYP